MERRFDFDMKLRLLLKFSLILSNTLYQGSGIRVVRFQPDNIPNARSIALYKGNMNGSYHYNSTTFCVTTQVFYLQRMTIMFYMSDASTGTPFQMFFGVEAEKVAFAAAARFRFSYWKNAMELYRWYHYCFTYDSTETMFRVYSDGELLKEFIYNIRKPIFGDTAMLGKWYSRSADESYSGDVAQVNIWDYALKEEEIAAIASCKRDPQGNILSWNKEWELHEVETYEAPIGHFCNQTVGTTYFWFPDHKPEVGYYLCEALGTHLPLPETETEAQSLLNAAQGQSPNETRCNNNILLSINDNDVENRWVFYYNGSTASQIKFESGFPYSVGPKPVPWLDGEPNGDLAENCAEIELPGWVADIECSSRLVCVICPFKHRQVYSFVGTCEIENRNKYFLAYQKEMGHLMFRGYGYYVIQKVGNAWKLLNIIENRTIATMMEYDPYFPMGRRSWKIHQSMCGQKSGERTLLLTPCKKNQFSCDDATCIPLENRCDLKYDCIDKSDEKLCNLIRVPEYYKNDLPPRLAAPSECDRLPIIIHFNIESMSIDTTEMTIDVTYELTLIWLDDRLTYVNLKSAEGLNQVPFSVMKNLWLPGVGFLNTDGNQHTQIDEEVNLYIMKRSDPFKRDEATSSEENLYNGNENPIKLKRKYSTKFVCSFNLVLYPFDEEICDFHLGLLSASASQVKFQYNESSVTYRGTTLLVEYEIRNPFILEASLPNNLGDNTTRLNEIHLRIPMVRRYGYALLNIYTPSLILLAISYLTLFFKDDIFEVRVMSALTALLVVATLFTQASSSLPKTSYFKMVDVWLLFCIAIIFLIIIFHTLIDNYTPNKFKSIPHNEIEAFQTPPKFLQVTGLGEKASPRLAFVDKMTSSLGAGGSPKTAHRLIVISKTSVLAILVLFNAIYWGTILKSYEQF